MERVRSSLGRVGLMLLITLVATPLLGVPRAGACSCFQSDPRDDLHAADGAFIGTYVGREPTNPADPYAEYDYMFETDTVFKGDVGDVVRVRAPANGAACGLEYQEGTTGALFLRSDEGIWRSNLCSTENPERMRAAARPFPEPNAKGPPRLLVGGSFGEVRVIALDLGGRTAGYGYGEGDALDMSLCPGRTRSVEVVGSAFAGAPVFVDVRRIEDLSITRTMEGPARWDDQPILPVSGRCLTPDGEAVVFVDGFDDEGEFTEIVMFRADGVTTIHKGDLRSAALGRGEAYGADGRAVVSIDYDGGGRRTIRTMDRAVSHLALSPNGGLLAGLVGANDEGETSEVFVLRIEDGSVLSQRALEGAAPRAMSWLNDRSLLLGPRAPASLVLNRKLEQKTKVGGWFAAASASVGCWLYGVGSGAVARVSLCERDDIDIVREFFSPITYALTKLPKSVEIDAPPR